MNELKTSTQIALDRKSIATHAGAVPLPRNLPSPKMSFQEMHDARVEQVNIAQDMGITPLPAIQLPPGVPQPLSGMPSPKTTTEQPTPPLPLPTSKDDAPLTTATVKAVNDTNPNKLYPFDTRGVLNHIDDARRFTAWILGGGSFLHSADELEKLNDIQRRMDDSIALAEKFSNPAAVAEHQAQQQAFEAAAHVGKLDDAPYHRSLADIQENHRRKRLAIEKTLVTITHEESIPLCKTILERAGKIFTEQLRESEHGERELLDGIGLEFTPSLIWRATAMVYIRYALRRLPAPGVWQRPSDILGDLFFDPAEILFVKGETE